MENRKDIVKHILENFVKYVKKGKTHIRKDQLIAPEYRDTKIGMKRMAVIINEYYSKNPYLFKDKEDTHYYNDEHEFIPEGFKVREIDALVGCELKESKRDVYTGGQYKTIIYYRILPVRKQETIKI